MAWACDSLYLALSGHGLFWDRAYLGMACCRRGMGPLERQDRVLVPRPLEQLDWVLDPRQNS